MDNNLNTSIKKNRNISATRNRCECLIISKSLGTVPCIRLHYITLFCLQIKFILHEPIYSRFIRYGATVNHYWTMVQIVKVWNFLRKNKWNNFTFYYEYGGANDIDIDTIVFIQNESDNLKRCLGIFIFLALVHLIPSIKLTINKLFVYSSRDVHNLIS